jgi:hypothetical protein
MHPRGAVLCGRNPTVSQVLEAADDRCASTEAHQCTALWAPVTGKRQLCARSGLEKANVFNFEQWA